MRKLLLLTSLAAALAATALLRGDAAQGPAPARVVVAVPEDARVYFGDYLTKQTGAERTFTTPPLEPGSSYNYQVKVEVTRQGQTASQTRTVAVRAGQTSNVDFSAVGEEEADDGWPRRVTQDGNTLTVYQPQIDTFEKNKLAARAAVSVELKASPQPTYGVVWITARADVDREKRLVTLDNVQITKASFPTAPAKDETYLKAIRTLVPDGARTISLDRILANLAITQAEAKVADQPFKSDAPKVYYSGRPAALVLVDGKPALRQVEGSKLLRVINTRALILLDEKSGKYYLHFVNRWMQANAVEGPWEPAVEAPPALDEVKRQLADNPAVDLLDDPAPDLKEALDDGITPTVYVSTVPAELLETEGEPDLVPIDGTKLLYVKNTSDQILMDLGSNLYYTILSGRWYRSKSLQEGPWEHVAGDKLPADFAKVPSTHPKGDVLASIPATPEAKEAAIANSIPQTATVSRKEAKIEPVFDGDPEFQPVEGTELKYAVNTPVPVIQVSPTEYYAVENGVWFTAAAPAGPWAVATAVPPAIYTIPPSSPIYYCTHVYVYDSTPEVVYVGYTPGYLGAYTWGGSVVYGTGWYYRPWIGRAWYGRPWTYGFGVGVRWAPGYGWSFGAAAAVGRPWWGPAGWNASWGRSNVWRAGWNNGWGGGYRGVHNTNININNANVYNRWRQNVVAPRAAVRAGPAARNTTVQNVRAGQNNVYAGRDGGVYRRADNNWQSAAPKANWANVAPKAPAVQNLNREAAARRAGEFQHRANPAPQINRPAPAAINRNPGGFRSPGASMPRGGGGGFRGGRR